MSGQNFTLLWSKILDSSIWMTDPETRLVWITMLAMKDAEGIVHSVPSALAYRARVTPEGCQKALDIFLSPDPQSSSLAYEGRRIERVEGGWKILNHEVYRFSTEAKREFWREQKRKQREAQAESEGRVPGQHGGSRKGAGRKRSATTMAERAIEEAETLKDKLRAEELADGAPRGAYGSGAQAQSPTESIESSAALTSAGDNGAGVKGDLNGSAEAPVDDTPDPDAMP